MLEAKINEYKERVQKFAEDVKEKHGDEILEYYKKVFTLVSTNFTIQEIYEKQIEEAIKENNFAKLKSVFYHIAKAKLLPCLSSGYDHCFQLWPLLDLLACAQFDQIYRILPDDLPLSTNGYGMYVNGINVLLCLLYNQDGAERYSEDKVKAKAEKFVTSKKPIWERAVVSCLLALLDHDVARFSDSLQTVCESYNKMSIIKYKKMQCQNAYGLLILARNIFSEEEFAKVTLPEYKNFSKGYIKWLFSQEELSDELCVTYDGTLEEIGAFLKKPTAITRIHQPYLDADDSYLSAAEKKAWHMDIDGMLKEFIEG